MEIIIGQTIVIPLPTLQPEAQKLVLVWIAPGTFLMGSPVSEPDRIADEEEQFQVTISRGFWLGQYPVTQAQWQAMMGHNPSHFQNQDQDCPVENVNWHDAMAFCQALNQQWVAYLPTDYHFRLPTEAQWEYACRAGTQTIYHSGNRLTDLSNVAWHKNNSEGHTHPVGQKAPNAWGLYDMHGNVAEWCYDPTSAYPDSSTIDWVGDGDGYVRSMRSGSYGTKPEDASFRCACRIYVEPEVKRAWFGFRLGLTT